MVLFAFSVYDNKAKAYLPPFFLPNQAMAIRAFADCANDSTHQFSRNSSDYTLFELSEFDDDIGLFRPHAVPLNLGLAASFKRPLITEAPNV